MSDSRIRPRHGVAAGSVQLLEKASTTQVGHHPLTEVEKRKHDAGTTEETITIDRLWNKRNDQMDFLLRNLQKKRKEENLSS
jgi:hypothetical protein